MRLVEYTPEYFDTLYLAARKMRDHCSLCHQPFVDYYYATRDWCKLYLFLTDDGVVAGTLGVDQLRFEFGDRSMTLGFGSNFFALQKGVGGHLFLQWMKSSSIGVVFGGSADTHKIIGNQKWTYFPGIKTFCLNRSYRVMPGEPKYRRIAKWWLRHFAPRIHPSEALERLPGAALESISVQEEESYQEDLLPRRSPFSFRFAPSADYLGWRYSTQLSFVRYRLFRILAEHGAAGYVIINDSPQRLMVAQCDGEDASILAYGILLSLVEVARNDRRPREVFLTSSHPQMQQIFRQFGFRSSPQDYPFALGALRRRIDLGLDTTQWLINFDWTDNGLRAPFRDQTENQGRSQKAGYAPLAGPARLNAHV